MAHAKNRIESVRNLAKYHRFEMTPSENGYVLKRGTDRVTIYLDVEEDEPDLFYQAHCLGKMQGEFVSSVESTLDGLRLFMHKWLAFHNFLTK